MPLGQTCKAGATILVAEDDVIVRIAIGAYLRDCGFHVIEAASGEEARIVLESMEVDVLMADARLAGGHGFALAQWARQHRPQIDVMLSAGIAAKCEAAARLCSGRDRIPPPVSHLRERIEAMNARQGRRARGMRGSRARGSTRRSA